MPHSGKIRKVTLLLVAVTVLTLFGLLENIFVTDGVKRTETRTVSSLVQVRDVKKKEKAVAGTPIGVVNRYDFTLNQHLSGDSCLAFYTVHQYVKVSMEGEEIYSLEPSGDNRVTKTVGSNWVMIPLSEEDEGKTVEVEITPVYEGFRNRKVDFLIGPALDIYRDRLIKDLPQIVLGGLAILVGVVFLLVAGYGKIRKKPDNGLASLGLFSVMMGIWRLMDTRFTPFMDFGKPVLVYYIGVIMPMLGLLPLIHWAKGFFRKECRRVLEIYEMSVLLLTLVQFSLQYFGTTDFRETLIFTHIAIGIGAFCLFAIVVYERWREKTKEIPIELSLGLICVVGILLDVSAFYLKGNSSGLVFTLLGFLIYISCMGILSVQKYSRQQRELARLDRQLTDNRIKAMMSQIRSHFIFNVLATISTYCKIDPKEADRALVCFSRYLRRNIQYIEEEGLIDFSLELEQVEDYVKLEQLRFGDRISFATEIETTSFQIPPLTIQPLVENGIKHGIIEKGKSGTVTLQTFRNPKGIEIRIVDDGVGFEPHELERKESVGIRNVRYRLESMLGGTIDFHSAPGKGTTVVICLPDKGENQ